MTAHPDHQPVLYRHHASDRLTQVACSCGARLGLVPVTHGMAAVYELLRVHRAGVLSHG
jgi:hypothetical protein